MLTAEYDDKSYTLFATMPAAVESILRIEKVIDSSHSDYVADSNEARINPDFAKQVLYQHPIHLTI